MAGIVFAPDGRDWGVSSSVFYWVVKTLATRVQHPDLAARLREISEYNLGSLNAGNLPETQQHDLSAAVRDLPDVAAAELPASAERDAVIAQVNKLAGLFQL